MRQSHRTLTVKEKTERIGQSEWKTKETDETVYY